MSTTVISLPWPITSFFLSLAPFSLSNTCASLAVDTHEDFLPTCVTTWENLPVPGTEVSPQTATFARAIGNQPRVPFTDLPPQAATMAWMSLVNQTLQDSRPMTNWERKAAANAFWAEFD